MDASGWAVVWLVLLVAASWLVAVGMFLYCKLKMDCAKAVIEGDMREIASLKVAMGAAEFTGDAKRICNLTLAALKSSAEPDAGKLPPELPKVVKAYPPRRPGELEGGDSARPRSTAFFVDERKSDKRS